MIRHAVISTPVPPPLREIDEIFTLQAVTLALTDQQYIPAYIVEEWLDRLPYERRDRLVMGLYYAGMIDHGTAKGFVPLIDEAV